MRPGTHTPKIAVLCHLFYEDSAEALREELRGLHPYDPSWLFNICAATPAKSAVSQALQHAFPGCFIMYTSNKGKDIGGKLALLSLYQQLQAAADYLLFLHDKKSLQAVQDVQWRKDLLRIVEPDRIASILEHFFKHPYCGIVASKPYIRPENLADGAFKSHNTDWIKQLLNAYTLKPKTYDYVAGTMFWARAAALENFFGTHHPLTIRKTLEEGNVLDNFSGTYTHSWERLFSWIITSQGYQIHGM